MKKILYFIGICFICSLNLISCSGSAEKVSKTEVETGNLSKMLKQIDQALVDEDFNFAFKVVNTLPSYISKSPTHDSPAIYYYEDTGEITHWHGGCGEFTAQQYAQKAISVLKAEGDFLLSKEDPNAEILFLDHLSDFDLGANTVKIGKFFRIGDENSANQAYKDNVTAYNDFLISIIRKALIKNKLELAKKIAFLVRDGLSYKVLEKYKYDRDDYFDWQYDTEAKDEAKELIENYIKSN